MRVTISPLSCPGHREAKSGPAQSGPDGLAFGEAPLYSYGPHQITSATVSNAVVTPIDTTAIGDGGSYVVDDSQPVCDETVLTPLVLAETTTTNEHNYATTTTSTTTTSTTAPETTTSAPTNDVGCRNDGTTRAGDETGGFPWPVVLIGGGLILDHRRGCGGDEWGRRTAIGSGRISHERGTSQRDQRDATTSPPRHGGPRRRDPGPHRRSREHEQVETTRLDHRQGSEVLQPRRRACPGLRARRRDRIRGITHRDRQGGSRRRRAACQGVAREVPGGRARGAEGARRRLPSVSARDHNRRRRHPPRPASPVPQGPVGRRDPGSQPHHHQNNQPAPDAKKAPRTRKSGNRSVSAPSSISR